MMLGTDLLGLDVVLKSQKMTCCNSVVVLSRMRLQFVATLTDIPIGKATCQYLTPVHVKLLSSSMSMKCEYGLTIRRYTS